MFGPLGYDEDISFRQMDRRFSAARIPHLDIEHAIQNKEKLVGVTV